MLVIKPTLCVSLVQKVQNRTHIHITLSRFRPHLQVKFWAHDMN